MTHLVVLVDFNGLEACRAVKRTLSVLEQLIRWWQRHRRRQRERQLRRW
jgi:hypothetical protein